MGFKNMVRRKSKRIDSSIQRIDPSLEEEIKEIQQTMHDFNGYDMSFREASKVMADVFKRINKEQFIFGDWKVEEE